MAFAPAAVTSLFTIGGRLRALLVGIALVVIGLLAQTVFASPAQALTGVNLATYKRVGRYELPEPTRTTPPAGSLLAQEASGVTYDWDTDTLLSSATGAPRSSRSARRAR